MARPRNPANSLYEAGPVRVVNRKPRGYRVLWAEGRRQRERGATTLDDAKDIAHQVAARLWSDGEQPASAHHPFGVLVSAATDPRHRAWTEEWAYRVESIARLHIIPRLGHIPVGEISRQHIAGLLQVMDATGYSRQYIKHTRNVIKLAVDEGIQREVWDSDRNPLVGVVIPQSKRASHDGRPDLSMIPTDEQVSELIVRMASDRPVYGVMAATAAYTGVRWGELLALTVDSIRLDAERLRVTHNCVEKDTGRFQFRVPMKRNARAREVILDPVIGDVLEDWVCGLSDGFVPGPHIDSGLPGRLLFSTRNGNAFRRSAFNKVFWRHADRVFGWPSSATWHYLRHYAATRWIRLGVEPPTASKMLGHSQISTTYDWYVNVDAKALERAANILSQG